MIRTFLSLMVSMLIVSAASFAVAQEEPKRDQPKPRVESRHADQHAKAIDGQRQRLEKLRMALRQGQNDRVDPEQLEKIERTIMGHERQLEEMVRGLAPHDGPGPEHHLDRESHEREQIDRERAEHERAMMERLEHLHQASVHLRHAGLGDLSDRVMEHIHEMERELERNVERPPHREGRPPEFGELQDQINDLRRAMQELGEQLQQMRRER